MLMIMLMIYSYNLPGRTLTWAFRSVIYRSRGGGRLMVDRGNKIRISIRRPCLAWGLNNVLKIVWVCLCGYVRAVRTIIILCNQVENELNLMCIRYKYKTTYFRKNYLLLIVY